MIFLSSYQPLEFWLTVRGNGCTGFFSVSISPWAAATRWCLFITGKEKKKTKTFLFKRVSCWLWACYLAERESSDTEVTVLISFDPFLPEYVDTIVRWFFLCQPLGLETVRLWCLNVQNWMWKAVAGKSESNEISILRPIFLWSCVGQGGCRLLPCEIRLRTATTLPVMLRLLWWICARAWKWK